jgi:hypothetical protein
MSDEQTDGQDYQDVDLDVALSEEAYQDEIENGEVDPIYDSLSDEEKALLAKIEKKQREADPIVQMFRELENRPSEEDIERMKMQVGGEVYLVSFTEKENFLFRPLKRLEWRTLMNQIQKLDEFKKSEAIVMKSVLWPSLSQQNINMLSAGAIDSLKELVLQASNFMPPEYAMSLVRKL